MCVAASLACTACRHGYIWHHRPKPASRFCATITRRKDAARSRLKCREPATDKVCTACVTVTHNLLLHMHGHSMPAFSAATHMRLTMHSTPAVDCQDNSSLKEHCELPSSCDMACSRIKPPRLQESSDGRLQGAHTHAKSTLYTMALVCTWRVLPHCNVVSMVSMLEKLHLNTQVFERRVCKLMCSCLSCAEVQECIASLCIACLPRKQEHGLY